MNYGNGFFYLAEIGDFRLAQNGCFHLALTTDGVEILKPQKINYTNNFEDLENDIGLSPKYYTT